MVEYSGKEKTPGKRTGRLGLKITPLAGRSWKTDGGHTIVDFPLSCFPGETLVLGLGYGQGFQGVVWQRLNFPRQPGHALRALAGLKGRILKVFRDTKRTHKSTPPGRPMR